MFVDVQPIGPQGSSVGFAEVNQYFHTLFGVNMLLYSITDWLSIAVLFNHVRICNGRSCATY